MRERTFLEFMDDPIDWFEEAARLARLHHAHLTEQSPQAADATDDTDHRPHGELGISDDSRTASASPAATGRTSGCSVIQLDSRRT